MAESTKAEELLREFYAHQRQVKGYIYSSIRDYHATQDLFQEVAIAIARKADTFDPSRPALPWFFGIARFEILSWLRTRGKTPSHVSFDVLDACIGEMSELAPEPAEVNLRERALQSCIEELPPRQRTIVALRYQDQRSCSQIAESVNRSVQSVYALLKRLKLALRDCVGARMKQELS